MVGSWVHIDSTHNTVERKKKFPYQPDAIHSSLELSVKGHCSTEEYGSEIVVYLIE